MCKKVWWELQSPTYHYLAPVNVYAFGSIGKSREIGQPPNIINTHVHTKSPIEIGPLFTNLNRFCNPQRKHLVYQAQVSFI